MYWYCIFYLTMSWVAPSTTLCRQVKAFLPSNIALFSIISHSFLPIIHFTQSPHICLSIVTVQSNQIKSNVIEIFTIWHFHFDSFPRLKSLWLFLVSIWDAIKLNCFLSFTTLCMCIRVYVYVCVCVQVCLSLCFAFVMIMSIKQESTRTRLCPIVHCHRSMPRVFLVGVTNWISTQRSF